MRSFRLFFVSLLVGLLLIACSSPPAPEAPEPTEAMAEEATPAPAEEVSEKAAVEDTTETEAAAEGSPRTIIDGEGNELTFAAPPERLVCTYSRCMELLAALELEPVGVTTWEESFIKDPAYFQQPVATEILSYDGDFPDLERLAALEPDLVFGWQEMSEALAGIVPVYMVANDQDSYAESHDEIRAFAQLLGREEIARRSIQKALDRLAAYKQRSPNNLSVMYGFFSDGAFSYRDGDSGTCNLFKEIARCDWPDPTNSSSWSVEVGDEGLLALDPEVLLVDSYGFEGKTHEEIIAEVSTRPLWGELQAVKNGRVYVASDDVANLDGMGTVGMQKMLDVYAPLLYPDVFPAPLTDAQVQEILAGEAAQPATSESFFFTNSDGSVISFDTPPQRIICLFHECLEILAALGVEPIATSDWSIPRMFAANPLYFKQPNNIEFIPDKDDAPDFEIIAKLQPDVVIGWPDLIEPLKEVAPVIDSGSSNDYRSTLSVLRAYAQLLDKAQEAEAAIQKFTDRLNAYKKLAPRDITVLQSGTSDGKSFWVSTNYSTPCSLYNEVVQCDWPDPNPVPGIWGYMTDAEGLLSLDPDVIILESWDDTIPVETWREKMAEDPLLSELKAVKNNRILADTNRDSYGIGVIGGARFLDTYMPLFYPDIFPEPLTDEEVQEILAEAE